MGSHNTLEIIIIILFCGEDKACMFFEGFFFFAYSE